MDTPDRYRPLTFFHNHGSVLLSAMMLVLVMTLLGAGVFYAAVIDNRMVLNDTHNTQTFFIAESGLDVGRRELSDGNGTNDFTQVFTNGGSVALFTNTPFPVRQILPIAWRIPIISALFGGLEFTRSKNLEDSLTQALTGAGLLALPYCFRLYFSRKNRPRKSCQVGPFSQLSPRRE